MMNQVHQVLQTHLVQNLRTQSDSPDSSSSSSTSRTDSGTQSDSPAPSEPEKANSEPSNERKIKETGYRLNELTAYRYDLIDVDDDADKAELAKKLNDVITHKNGAIPILNGSFIYKHNYSPLTGLSINKSIKPETKSQINTLINRHLPLDSLETVMDSA
nr:hypothetical protein [Mycoplasmopsis bovis]